MKPCKATLAAVTTLALNASTVLAQDKFSTGAITWDTTNNNIWATSSGGTYDQPFVSGDNAIFEGTPGTITLGEAITANSITFSATSSGYIIEGNTLDLTGGKITQSVGSPTNVTHTITSAIIGSPSVDVATNTAYQGLTFAPTNGMVALGVCTVPSADGGSDKAGLTLGGTTTGNTLSQVQYYGNRRYGAITKKGSGSWTVGNVVIGIVNINDGDLIANGEIETKYAGLKLNVGATLHYNNEGAVKGGSFNFLGGSLDNTSGAAITTSLYNPASSWGGNWTFLGSGGADSDLNLGTGAVTLTGNRTVTVQDAATTLTIDGAIGDGLNVYGLAKAGEGTLVLTAANTYNGATTVSAGTLSLGDGTNNSSLDDGAILEIAGTGTLNLNFAAGNVDTVFALTFDDDLQATGTWGRIGHVTADHTSAKITGDGLINNLGGAAPAGTNFWDGSLVDGSGNGVSDGGSGIWSTSNANWDVGFASRVIWPNNTADKAIFRATAGTVTLDSDVTLGEILIDGIDNYFIGDSPEENSLNFGGAINKIIVEQVKATIRAGITGSPALNLRGGSNDQLWLDPDSASMTLGEVTVGGAGGNNPVLYLQGTTTGNSITEVINANNWSRIFKQDSGAWTLGDVSIGGINLQAGTLVLNGTYNPSYTPFHTFTGGTLKGTGTLNMGTKLFSVPTSGTVAPGTSVGTLTINGNVDYDGTLEIEVEGATADVLAIDGNLDLTGSSIVVPELAAATLTDYKVLTYTGSLTGTFATETLPAGYSVDYDTANEIHLLVAGGGPGSVDSFDISAIASPQVQGTPITGITITAKDASDAVATGFTGTVNLSGTGGFTGTSGSFTAGVLTGVSVTPTIAGSGLTLVVTNSDGPSTGSTTITTIESLFEDWSGAGPDNGFDEDKNGDGVDNGIAFLLGAANPNADATGLLPTISESGGALTLTFDILKAENRGSAALAVEHSTDLGDLDAWLGATIPTPANDVSFVVTPGGGRTDKVVATITAAAAERGDKLFGRLKGTK